MVTFAIGVATLGAVRFPRPERTAATTASLREDAVFGWGYLRARPGLFGLLWIYAGVNFMLSFGNVLFIPLIVSIASEAAAGAVLSAAGVGAVVGSLVVSAWGGPQRLVRGVIAGIGISGVLVAVTGLRPSLPLIATGTVLLMLVVPIVNTTSQVIWQTKVEPALQGRVFSLRRMLANAVSPLAILAAGPLADRVFEPLLAEGGRLAGTVGEVLGTGPGRGIGLLMVVSGLATIGLAVTGWLLPRVRNLEGEIPDALSREEAQAG